MTNCSFFPLLLTRLFMQNTLIKDSSAASSLHATICKERARADPLPLHILLLPRSQAGGAADWSQAHGSMCCTGLSHSCALHHGADLQHICSPLPALRRARAANCASPCQTGWQRGLIIIYGTEGYPVGIRRTLKITSVCNLSGV